MTGDKIQSFYKDIYVIRCFFIFTFLFFFRLIFFVKRNHSAIVHGERFFGRTLYLLTFTNRNYIGECSLLPDRICDFFFAPKRFKNMKSATVHHSA